MEVDEIKSDLYALRQLYGLLQSLVTRQNVFKSLDERALQFLRRLLDDAMHNLSIIEMKADHNDQPKITTKSKQIVPSKPRHNNNTSDQQMVNADFASSSTGFSTPTSLGFEDDIVDDTNSDSYEDGDGGQHGNFSKQVSKATGELDSHILAIHLQEANGSRASHPNHNVKTNPKESKMASASYDHVSGSRIPSPPVDSNDKVYRKTRVDHHVRIRNRKPRHNNFTLAPHRGRIVPQPSYSTDKSRSAYSSDIEEEENSRTSPSEGSESIDDHYDHDDDYYDDGDEVQTSSCSTCSGNSNSSYGTAKSGATNTDYPRRRVQDYSERVTRVSTLRRIKNKLGLIFHHHHHHHHHEYHHDDRDHGHSPNHLRRSRSSKPVHGMFRDDNKRDEGLFDTRTKAKDATRRGSRAMRSNVDRVRRGGGDGGTGDAGHFRALVEAMTKHVGGGGRRKQGRRGGGGGVKINGNHRRGRLKFGFKKASQPHKLKM